MNEDLFQATKSTIYIETRKCESIKKKSVPLKMLPSSDTVDKNLPDNAGDIGSIPGSGRSHKYKQLSLCTTTEPVL